MNNGKLTRKAIDKAIAEVFAAREEILKAFVAKFGFEPDECEQIVQGSRWCVVRIDPKRVEGIQREVILARLRRKKFSTWQKFCLALAGIR